MTITKDIRYIGVNDHAVDLFEGQYVVPGGMCYNSYAIVDEKVAIMDTVDRGFTHQWLDNIQNTLGGRKPDYLVVQHMEPDHAADIRDLLVRHPETTVVCSAAAKNMLAQFFGPGYEGRISVVKEGDTLCTGRHTLHFVAAPMVHWPEVLMTYDETDKLLLTADAFGTFGALNGALFADEVDFHRDYLDEARRYYTNIVGKYGAQVQAVLKKAGGLDIQMLLPLHGFVWRQDLGYILGKYDLWSRYEPEERGVVIAYASVYGGTENAANILACRLREQGVQVAMYDTSVTPASYILAAAFRFSHVVLAAPTYNAGVFVTMENLLHDLTAHTLKNRRVAYIENGSWAPTSARGMQKLLEPLKWEQAADTVTLRSALRQGQQEELERMAMQLADSVNA